MSTAIQEKTASTIGLHLQAASQEVYKNKAPTPEECVAQVARLTASPLFLGSESLCKLLKYLSHHTLHTPMDHLKEYTIATEVFSRPSDFNPQTDSYVRVQMGRLRSKLSQYYETEGIADTVVVDVPKGRYVLSFERRDVHVEIKPPVEIAASVEPASIEEAPASASSNKPQFLIAGAALAVALLVLVWVLARGAHFSAAVPAAATAPNAPRISPSALWAPFVSSSSDPIVVFATADFVGEAETGMRYYEPSRDSHSKISQHYTGVGEVIGVLELDRLFHSYNRQFRVKRGSLFTLDDARNNNLIFVGSPTENLTLNQIPATQEFEFRRIASSSSHWKEVIVNTHPLPGESGMYVATDGKANEGSDYAVIALRHGLDPSQWTLILAGTSTIGTQGAVDFACDDRQIENLLKRLGVSKTTEPKPFEALLQIKMANDVPLSVQMVALHPGGR